MSSVVTESIAGVIEEEVSDRAGPPSGWRPHGGHGALRWFVLLLTMVVILVPLIFVVGGSFKSNAALYRHPFSLNFSPTISNYVSVVKDGGMGQALLNSIIVSVVTTVVTIALASLAAFGVTFLRGWRGILPYGFLVLGLAIPAQASIIPQFVLFRNLHLLNSLVGLIVINVALLTPVAVFILTSFNRKFPVGVLEASLLDGCSTWGIFWRIITPLSRAPMSASAILVFLGSWNDLLYPLLFIQDPSRRTLPLALLDLQGQYVTNYPVLFAGVVIASVPMMVLYVTLQRHFVSGIMAGSVTG
ncbi:MAG: carbohydrate ABC transporter permease [Acidimicrobiales bacterium]